MAHQLAILALLLVADVLAQPAFGAGAPTPAGLTPAVSSGSSQTLTVAFYASWRIPNARCCQRPDQRRPRWPPSLLPRLFARLRTHSTLSPTTATRPRSRAKSWMEPGRWATASALSCLSGSSASGSGNTFTLGLNLTFSASFGGNKVVYAAARDLAQKQFRLADHGCSWRATTAFDLSEPGRHEPSSGNTLTQTITFTYQDQTVGDQPANRLGADQYGDRRPRGLLRGLLPSGQSVVPIPR